MVNSNKLKGVIAERGYSQAKVAEKLGITPKTFYDKMKRQVFDSDEMEIMIDLLEIQNPVDIFFDNKVT